MATDKSKSETLSVEQRLKSLYQLQTLLSEIDRIKTIRGELPLEVKDLEDGIEGLNTRISNNQKEIDELRHKSNVEREKINESLAKIERYKEQLNDIKNSKEFSVLSKEIEFQSLEIQLCEKHLNEFARIIDNKSNDIAYTQEILVDKQHILDEKKVELDEIVSETRQEEEVLREKAKALEPKIDARTLTAFKRIRKKCAQWSWCGLYPT